MNLQKSSERSSPGCSKHIGKGLWEGYNKRVFVAEKEIGKVYKVVLVLTKDDQSAEEVTVLLNEKGESVEWQFSFSLLGKIT